MEPTAFTVDDLARLLREAEVAHGEFERSAGHVDANWPDWYAAYIFPRMPACIDYSEDPEKLPSTEPYLGE